MEPIVIENTVGLSQMLAKLLIESNARYQQFREMLIDELGYDNFRDIQKDAFRLLVEHE